LLLEIFSHKKACLEQMLRFVHHETPQSKTFSRVYKPYVAHPSRLWESWVVELHWILNTHLFWLPQFEYVHLAYILSLNEIIENNKLKDEGNW